MMLIPLYGKRVTLLSYPCQEPFLLLASLIGKNAVMAIGRCTDSKLGQSEDYSVKS